jgi:hypothetical protein
MPVNTFCRRYGRPLGHLPARLRSALCVGVGCSWIVLYNIGRGFGFAEYGASPYGWAGSIVRGAVALQAGTRYRHITSWSDRLDRNCGTGFCGYHSVHFSARGWCWTDMYGWALVSGGIVAHVGPVGTWSYIT